MKLGSLRLMFKECLIHQKKQRKMSCSISVQHEVLVRLAPIFWCTILVEINLSVSYNFRMVSNSISQNRFKTCLINRGANKDINLGIFSLIFFGATLGDTTRQWKVKFEAKTEERVASKKQLVKKLIW